MIDDALFRLTQSCVRLRSFITNAVLLISTIQNICELVEQRKLGNASEFCSKCEHVLFLTNIDSILHKVAQL